MKRNHAEVFGQVVGSGGHQSSNALTLSLRAVVNIIAQDHDLALKIKKQNQEFIELFLV
jgi:hypothetical protein